MSDCTYGYESALTRIGELIRQLSDDRDRLKMQVGELEAEVASLLQLLVGAKPIKCYGCHVKTERIAELEGRVTELEAALRDIAAQDLDENGEPDIAGHLANDTDAEALAGALVYCAAKAREALKGGG
jgi:hypothetical protein